MKYLKTYENYTDNMRVGDYVLLNMKQIKSGLDSFSADESWYELPDENTVALIELISSDEDFIFHLYPISVIFSDNNELNVTPYDVLRLATPKEIEDYENKRTEQKYNL